MKVTGWAFDRNKEAFEKVTKDEARKLSTVQESMMISTDYLRRIIPPAGEQRGVMMSYLCPHCPDGKIAFGWSLGEKSTQIGGAEATKTGSWWCKQAKVLTGPRSSERLQYLRAFAEI